MQGFKCCSSDKIALKGFCTLKTVKKVNVRITGR